MESKPLLSLILIFAILAGFSFAATDVSTCANISSPGSYVLNQSINGTGSAVTGISNISYACIRINSSNVAFDCNGFNISGNGSQTAGIAVNGSATSPLTNITIKNCPMIFNYSNGVVIQYANLSVIQNVTSTGSRLHGFFINNTALSNFTNNTAYNTTGNGFYVIVSRLANISGNNAINSTIYGFNVNNTNDTAFVSNAAINTTGTGDGFHVELSNNNTFLANTMAFSARYGFALYDRATNSTLDSNTAYNNTQYGFYIGSSNNSALTNNTAYNNSFGFALSSSSNNNLTSNNASNNSANGFNLGSSSNNNTLTNNTAYKNTQYGFYIGSSNYNRLTNNTAYNNGGTGTFSGIYFTSSNNSVLTNNIAYNNSKYGFYLTSTSNYNAFTNNTAYNNSDSGFCLATNSNNNTFTNNTAYNNSINGFLFWNSSNNNLFNNSAYNNSYAGFLFSPASLSPPNSNNNTITNNSAYNNQYGFFLNIASNNTLTNNTAYNNVQGFYIYWGSNYNNITRNTAYNNSYSGFQLDTNSNNNTLTSNSAYNNSVYGFYLYTNPASNTFINNTAYNNSDTGFYIESGFNNNFTNNSAYNNTRYGFYLHSSNNNLTNNTATNSQYGFYLYFSSFNTLTNNNASNNSVHGFYLRSSPNNNFTNNSAYNNSQYGFYLYVSATSNNNFTSNTAYKNQYGFYISSGPNNNFTTNTAYNNSEYGFYFSSSSNNNLTSNTAYNNSNGGFRLDSSSNYNTLTNNTAYNNTNVGFYLTSNSNNNLTSNTAYNNSYAGFYLFSSSNYNNIINNTAYNNSKYGIGLYSSSNNNLTNNVASNNTQYGFYLDSSSDTNNLINNTAYNNTQYGIYISSSNSTNLTNTHVYNNAVGAVYLTTDTTPRTVYFTNLSVDNPAGNYTNYTSLDISDIMNANSAYSINWSRISFSLPAGYISFAQKFVNISNLSGTPSIDSITWHWDQSEVSGTYTESKFELWKYGASGWGAAALNSTPNTTANTLTLYNTNPASIYGILVNVSGECPVITSPGAYTQLYNYAGAPNDASSTSSKACVVIAAENVTFDCNGHTITNNGTADAYGIFANSSANNATIKNCPSVLNYTYGVGVSGLPSNEAGNIIISNTTSINSSDSGIYLYYARNATIRNSTASGSAQGGFTLENSAGNRIANSTAYNSPFGIELESTSDNNSISNNTLYSNSGSGTGISIDTCSGNNITGNTIHDTAEGIYATLANNNIFMGNNITNIVNDGLLGGDPSILENGGDYNQLINNVISYSQNNYGIYFSGNHNNFTNNTVFSTGDSCIRTNGNWNIFENNTAYDCDLVEITGGAFEIGDYNNTLAHNHANSSNNGYYIEGDGNLLANNTAYGNYLGINVLPVTGAGNSIIDNVAEESTFLDFVVGGDIWLNYGFIISGINLPPYVCNNIVTNLTGSGGRLILYINGSGAVSNGVYSGIGVCNGNGASFTNVTILGSNTLNNNGFVAIISNGTRVANSTSNNNLGGFWAVSSENTLVESSNASGNAIGFAAVYSNGTSFTGCNAYNNNVTSLPLLPIPVGIGAFFWKSNGVLLNGIRFYNNSFMGLGLWGSSNISIISSLMYNNGYDFAAVGPSNYNMTTSYFLNPSGTYENYTNVSAVDSLASGEAYSINWTRNSSGMPTDRISFRNKFVNISMLATATVQSSIDKITWSWSSSELGGYTPSKFELWKYNASGWGAGALNSTPNTTANTLTLYNMSPASEYGILQNSTITNCLAISTQGDYMMGNNYTGAPNAIFPDAADANYACVVISASDVLFDCNGFNITNNGTDLAVGIYINGSAGSPLTNVTVRNCPSIDGYTSAGVYLNRAENSLVANASAVNGRYGFEIAFSHYNLLANLTAYGGTAAGIAMGYSNSNNITDSILDGNGDSGVIITFTSSYNLLANNTAYSNTNNGFDLESNSNYNNLTDNTAHDNGGDGFFSDSSPSNFINNTAHDNGALGFRIRLASYQNLINNTAYSNTEDGFRLNKAPNSIFRGNNATGNIGAGFTLWNSPRTIVDASTFCGNGGRGLEMDNSGESMVSNSTACGNTNDAFYILNSNHNNLTNNTASNSTKCFDLYSSSDNILTNNTAYCNTSNYGFYLEYSSNNNTLTNNTAYNNFVGFVLYIYSNNNTLTNNNASNNLVGFQIQSSSNNTVFNNTAYNNAWDGFVFSWSSDNNTVFNNSASNSAMGFELYSSSNNLLANNTASNSNTDGFDLEYSSNYNILTNNSAWNNNQGFNLYTSNYNTFTNNSAFNNSGTGFYMSVCSNNNLTSNSAWQNVYGFSLMYSSNYNNLINNTAYNNTNVGFSLSSNYNNIINNSAYNNSGDGFFIAYYSDYNNITGNTAYNDVNGIFLYGSNNILSNNTVHNNYYGIDLIYSAYNNLTNNTAYNNSQDGFYLGTSDYVNLTNNSAYNNSQYGFYIYSSDAANLTDCHAYNNTLGEFRASTDSTPRIFYANNLTIDNPYGNMANYTSLNITDTLAAGNDYIIKWAANPSALPGQATSFRGKYIDISIVSGSASIDSITWTWADSELGGYNEDLFKLVKYNASGWSYVPGQQLYAAQNTLNVSNLDSFSTFAILEYTTNVSVLKLNQTAQQPSPGGTVQFNITATNTGNITLNTEVWDVLPENLTFSNSYPPYDSTVPPRRYSWALSLSPGETRAIYLNATVNPGAVDSANPIVTLPNYANATGTSAVSAPVFEESTANVTIYYANASTVKVNLTAQIASQGGMVQYLINVTNTGNVSLNITVNDTLDNALKYNSSSDSGISTLQNVVWTLTGVTPGQTRQLYLNATVRNYPSQCQNTTNSLNVLGIPPNGDNVTATTSLIVPVCLANAVIKLDQTAAQPSPGGMVNFQLNITNTGNVTLSPVTLVDTLPPGLDYFNANWTPIIAGGTLTWNDIGPINPGETIIILLNATVNDSATATQCTVTLTNNINVEGQPPNGENATASDSKNVVVKCANISVIKINQAIAEPSPGGQVRFRINITNSGNVTLDTSVWDNMPENLTISGIYPAYNSTMPPRAYQWNFALSPGQTEFIYINATVDLGAVSELNPIVTLTNYVNATGTPPNGNSVFSEDSENVDVHYANVSILKIDITPFPPSQGGIVQYYIVATNTGNITLNPLEITDTLPTGFTFNSTNTSGYYLSGQDVIWGNVGPLSSGSSITILLNASVDEGTSSGAYTNTVNAQGTPPNGKDVFASGNATVGVNSSAINIVKTASNYSAVIGDNITFILNITNSGEINLTTFARDVLPAGVSFLAAIPAPDSVVGQELYWNSIGILQPGEYFEITYNISIASGGDKTNNAVATGVPPNGENATDSGSVTINVQSPYHEEHEPHEKFECITSYDCKECYTCRSNKCEILPGMCAQDSDCTQYGEGYYCDSCVCMHPECLEDSDCAKGFTCVNYVCVPPECWNDSDCREGLICDSFKCKEKPVEKPPWPEQKPISEVPVEPEKKPPLVVPETPKPVEVVQTNVPLVEEVGQQKPVSTSSDAIVYAIGGGVVVVLVLITYVFFKRKHKPTKGEAIE